MCLGRIVEGLGCGVQERSILLSRGKEVIELQIISLLLPVGRHWTIRGPILELCSALV